jgi:glycosyltransferase involved in cell wall biosynthesis
MPEISVLMTAYNREQYISQAINSVLGSTFTDFELIIVDDASTDATVQIAAKFQTDPRVKLHVNKSNIGDYPNRNRAASFAVGKYLKYLDSDDMLYPHGLQILYEAMVKYPEAGLGLCRPDSQAGLYPMELSSQQAYIDHFITQTGLLSFGPSFSIIRSDVFRAVGGFSGSRFFGDTEMWLKIAANYPVVKIVMGLIWYRVHEGQEMSIERQSFQPIHSRYMLMREFLSKSSRLMSPSLITAALNHQKQMHARTILSHSIRVSPMDAWSLFRQSGMSLYDLLQGLRTPCSKLFDTVM